MNETIEIAYKYGMPVFYSVVLLLVVYKFAIKVLNSYERRETNYSTIINDGMKGIADSLSELSRAHALHLQMYERLSKDVQDGFDRMHEANKYQRDEHKEIIQKIDNTGCRA